MRRARLVSVLLSFVMVISALFLPSAIIQADDNDSFVGSSISEEFMPESTGGKTVDDAINWLWSVEGTQVGDGECVALISAYVEYLGQSRVEGNGKDYAWNDISGWESNGWVRIQGATPQKGDILIWTGGQWGHVAIYESESYVWHQRYEDVRKVRRVKQSCEEI